MTLSRKHAEGVSETVIPPRDSSVSFVTRGERRRRASNAHWYTVVGLAFPMYVASVVRY